MFELTNLLIPKNRLVLLTENKTNKKRINDKILRIANLLQFFLLLIIKTVIILY